MIFRLKNQFWKCSAGAVAVVTALVIPVLLGFTSLGIEVGHWYLGQREMQGAADAAAISAAAQWIADGGTGTTYQTVGVSYASYNGFTIPTANVCLITSSGDNCGTVRSLDARTIPSECGTPTRPICVVVEITQDTGTWLTTKASLEPGVGTLVRSIPAPTLAARTIVSLYERSTTVTTAGTDCILALANDSQAVLVHGNGNLKANCGIAVDGGIDQNVGGTPLGGITFNGSNSVAHIANLIVAASSTGCPGSHCFLYNPPTTPLPAANIFTQTATLDPYASLTYPTPPLGVQTGGVAINAAGSGYTNGTCTFTVTGGTGTPAKFTATISGGKVTAVGSVTDPGAYTVFPTNPVTATGTCGTGTTAAKFNLTEGCFTWNNTAIAGRKYCSIIPSGTINFPTGDYYIAGGSSSCVGFCMSGNNIHVTSDVAGVTFYLTNGDGANSLSANSYATVSISGFGNSTTLSLCAPGTNCGTGCTGSCLLFIQGAPAAVLAAHPVPQSTSQGTPVTTISSFSGNGNSTLSGLVYLPKQTFQTQGNSEIAGCFGVVAKYVDVGGTPSFQNGCLPGNGIGGGTTTTTVFSPPYLYQ